MELTFLGTSCMVPTKERNVSSFYLSFRNEGILFDCGEGTQRQMNIVGIKRTSVTRILLSHWHGDHVSGLIGLIQTLGNEENTPTLHVYGPQETKLRMAHLFNTCIFGNKIDIIVHEVHPKQLEKIEDCAEFEIWAAPLNHSIPCIGYIFVEKDRHNIDKKKMNILGIKEGPHVAELKAGKSIVYNKKKIYPKDMLITIPGKRVAYIADTAVCKSTMDLANHADILVCESTYSHTHQEKAEKYCHLTATQAAQIASQSDAKKLYLTHFSQRYGGINQIEEDAKAIFPNSICARDFLRVTI